MAPAVKPALCHIVTTEEAEILRNSEVGAVVNLDRPNKTSKKTGIHVHLVVVGVNLGNSYAKGRGGDRLPG